MTYQKELELRLGRFHIAVAKLAETLTFRGPGWSCNEQEKTALRLIQHEVDEINELKRRWMVAESMVQATETMKTSRNVVLERIEELFRAPESDGGGY